MIDSFIHIATKVLPRIVALLLLCYLNLYFVYNFVYGNKGYLEYLEVSKEYKRTVESLSNVKKDYDFWVKKVDTLNPQNPNLDVLELQAREVFNYGKSGEVSIFTDR